MKRKLVKQGAATMMVSLPSKWIKKNNLTKGDEITLEEIEKKLIISNEKETNQKNKEITFKINDENKKDIKNLLTHAYRKGYDKIVLMGDIKDLIKEVGKIVPQILLGFELTQGNKEKIIIENISQPDKTKYNVMVSKIFLLIEETLNNLKQRNTKINLEEIIQTRNQCDKFILFCRKIIKDGKIEKNSLLEWEFLTFLTHIQHAYYYLAEYISKNNLKIETDVFPLIDDSEKYFSLVKKAYETKEIKFIHEINRKKNNYQFGRCLKLLEKSKNKNSVIASYLREIFRLIQISSSPILAEIINKNNP